MKRYRAALEGENNDLCLALDSDDTCEAVANQPVYLASAVDAALLEIRGHVHGAVETFPLTGPSALSGALLEISRLLDRLAVPAVRS